MLWLDVNTWIDMCEWINAREPWVWFELWGYEGVHAQQSFDAYLAEVAPKPLGKGNRDAVHVPLSDDNPFLKEHQILSDWGMLLGEYQLLRWREDKGGKAYKDWEKGGRHMGNLGPRPTFDFETKTVRYETDYEGAKRQQAEAEHRADYWRERVKEGDKYESREACLSHQAEGENSAKYWRQKAETYLLPPPRIAPKSRTRK
jgi:hypothetical protein